MRQKVFDILLVEDNPGDAFLICEKLNVAENFRHSLTHVTYLEDAINLLSQKSFDIILLDLTLPDSYGLETLTTISPHAHYLPIVVLTGIDDEELAIHALRQGAQDYLVKRETLEGVLVHAMRYAIERKKIEKELTTRTTQLEILNQELESFNYMVSHDLRNPLTIVKGMATLLKQKYDQEARDEQEKFCIDRLCSASDRMENIIQDLLLLSQVKQGELEMKLVNLTDLAQTISHSLSQQQPSRKIQFCIQPQIIAIGDENLLTHLLENLMQNAWKYTSEREDANIEIGVVESIPTDMIQRLSHINGKDIHDLDQNNWIRSMFHNLVYYIRDNGLGFDMQAAQHIFKPFHRLENATSFEGTGIGLAIVQRIIHCHNGQIWAHSSEGDGATFYFKLAV